MSKQLTSGTVFPVRSLVNIHKVPLQIPDPKWRWTHVQFGRFAGCPVCNLHVQTVIKRHDEITAAGVREVVIFHSSDERLLPFQGSFPFDVVGDPQKKLYKECGVEASIMAILNPAGWSAVIRGNLAKNKPSGAPENGPLGLPADFLIAADGTIAQAHYGAYASDQWSVDDLLKLAR